MTIRPEEPWHTSITTIRCHLREQAGEATEVTLPAQSLPGSRVSGVHAQHIQHIPEVEAHSQDLEGHRVSRPGCQGARQGRQRAQAPTLGGSDAQGPLLERALGCRGGLRSKGISDNTKTPQTLHVPQQPSC